MNDDYIPHRHTDRAALDRIAQILAVDEWTADTTEKIRDTVNLTGRNTAPPPHTATVTIPGTFTVRLVHEPERLTVDRFTFTPAASHPGYFGPTYDVADDPHDFVPGDGPVWGREWRSAVWDAIRDGLSDIGELGHDPEEQGPAYKVPIRWEE